jgi:hypothetical protein
MEREFIHLDHYVSKSRGNSDAETVAGGCATLVHDVDNKQDKYVVFT